LNRHTKELGENNSKNAKAGDRETMMKNQQFAALIESISPLMRMETPDRIKKLLGKFGVELFTEMHAGKKYTDPVLLTSVCEFAYDILNNEMVQKDGQLVDDLAQKMQNLVHLLPYLHGRKYREICEVAENYEKGAYNRTDNKATPPADLKNTYLHRLFIAIVNLIAFFSEYAHIQCEIMAACETVSRTLNSCDREKALFNILDVPEDSVKVAVINCLDKVSIEEFDMEEIGQLVRVIGAYKNLGAGKTEEVNNRTLKSIISK
jgi:hypothetical protein